MPKLYRHLPTGVVATEESRAGRIWRREAIAADYVIVEDETPVPGAAPAPSGIAPTPTTSPAAPLPPADEYLHLPSGAIYSGAATANMISRRDATTADFTIVPPPPPGPPALPPADEYVHLPSGAIYSPAALGNQIARGVPSSEFAPVLPPPPPPPPAPPVAAPDPLPVAPPEVPPVAPPAAPAVASAHAEPEPSIAFETPRPRTRRQR